MVGIASLAGCADEASENTEGDLADSNDESTASSEAYASFYTLYNFTSNVGGDSLSTENAVPTGQHGHGWEPPSDLLPAIVESDAFIYQGEGFQPWAEDVVSQIETDHEDEVVTIDAIEGIDLLEYDHDHDQENEENHDHDDEDDHGDHDDEDHESSDTHENEQEEHEEHDSGGNDPHTWLDPVLAQEMVATIRDGLIELDSDNEDAYVDNANAYVDQLEELHDTYEETLASRERDIAVIAGHDSYQYLGERYGIEFHTPQGVSPEDEPSSSDIAETIDLVEDEGIEYILYDYFDGDTLAQTIVNEADSAQEAIMISSAENLTEEWDAEGLDYIGQMEEINLPALSQALGAE